MFEFRLRPDLLLLHKYRYIQGSAEEVQAAVLNGWGANIEVEYLGAYEDAESFILEFKELLSKYHLTAFNDTILYVALSENETAWAVYENACRKYESLKLAKELAQLLLVFHNTPVTRLQRLKLDTLTSSVKVTHMALIDWIGQMIAKGLSEAEHRALETFDYEFHGVRCCQNCDVTLIARIQDCCRDPYLVVTIDRRSHDLYFLRYQCLTCGGCVDMSKPLPANEYQELIRAEFNLDRLKKWKTKVGDESKMLYSTKKEATKRNSKRFKYLEYLFSEEWRAKRQAVLDRDNCMCQQCKINSAEQVHHLTYDNLFDEPLEDLVSLCRLCHIEVHK